jgi:hypothetical protein
MTRQYDSAEEARRLIREAAGTEGTFAEMVTRRAEIASSYQVRQREPNPRAYARLTNPALKFAIRWKAEQLLSVEREEGDSIALENPDQFRKDAYNRLAESGLDNIKDIQRELQNWRDANPGITLIVPDAPGQRRGRE